MPSPQSNLLLDALLPETRARVLRLCKEVPLPLRTSLQTAEEAPRFVYFPTSGIASVVVSLAEGGAVEVGLVGHEGLAGSLALLGPSPSAADCFMQVAGTGLRAPFADVQALFLESEDLRARVLQFVQTQALMSNQIAACNKLHAAEPRLARWLLMVQDRVQTDVLNLTQEFLAEMLGTRRTTMVLAASALQRAGFLEYKRGKVKINSTEELRNVACDCYPITQRLLQGLYR